MKDDKMKRLAKEHPWHVQVFFCGEWGTVTVCRSDEQAKEYLAYHRSRSDRDYRIEYFGD